MIISLVLLVPPPATAALATSARCDTAIEPTPADEVPQEVCDEFGIDSSVLGSGDLWVLVTSAERAPVFDLDDDRWVLARLSGIDGVRVGSTFRVIAGMALAGSNSVREASSKRRR